ncbi:hypothetical protein CDD83_6797 [Cordyceps sp. RAO-2017]|nr:hypothetical protein CDD83_6797 [Cordyceps sp. RAO-2017]
MASHYRTASDLSSSSAGRGVVKRRSSRSVAFAAARLPRTARGTRRPDLAAAVRSRHVDADASRDTSAPSGQHAMRLARVLCLDAGSRRGSTNLDPGPASLYRPSEEAAEHPSHPPQRAR